jgi:outer membrane protein assembly factor BamD
MIKKLANVIFLSTAIGILISCTPEVSIKEMGFKRSFSKVKEKINQEKYVKAIEDLDVILLNFNGEQGIDSAQFLLAESHFKLDEFYNASYEYSKLTDNFPESFLSEEAMYKSALCYYNLSPLPALDQKETRKAITKFQFYLDKYKTGNFTTLSIEKIKELRYKLAEKEYNSGVLYLKMDQPRAAKVYFVTVLENYYDTDFYALALRDISNAYNLLDDKYNADIYLKKYNEISKTIPAIK